MSEQETQLYRALESGELKVSEVTKGARAYLNERGAWNDIEQPKPEAWFNLTLRYPLTYLVSHADVLAKMGEEVAQRFYHYDRNLITDQISRFQSFLFQAEVTDGQEKGFGRAQMLAGVFAKGERAVFMAGTVVTENGRLFYLYKPHKGNSKATEVIAGRGKSLNEFGEATMVEVPMKEAERLRIHIKDLLSQD